MSLIISLKIPECIIVASDSCMTMTTTELKDGVKQVTAMSYTAHTPKMVIFRDRLVVMYCDAMFVNSSLTVLQFLKDLRDKVSKNISPKGLSELIVEEYKKQTDGRNTVFIVSGYMGVKSYVFRVYTKDFSIYECNENTLGSSYNGETEIVHSMMKSIANYKNISAKDGMSLIGNVMSCVSCLAKQWKSQSVGDDIDMYIMFRNKSEKSGWLNKGQMISVIPSKESEDR